MRAESQSIVSASRDVLGQGLESRPYLNEIGDAPVPWDGLVPSINPFTPGAIAIVLTFAGMLTLAFGLALLARYRYTLARWMKVTPSGGSLASSKWSAVTNSTLGELPLRSIDARTVRQVTTYRSKAVAYTAYARLYAACVYAIAGIAFACCAATLNFWLSSVDFSFYRGTLVVWAWAWPVVLTLFLLWGPDRQRLALALLGYFGILFGFCIRLEFSETPALVFCDRLVEPFFQPLLLWSIDALPTAFLLLFLLPSVRAIGPALFILIVILSFGAAVATAVESTPIGLKALSIPMAALDLAPSVVDGTVKLLGMALAAPFGWMAMQHIGRCYQRHRFSDQMLVFDSIWLYQTLLVGNHIATSSGPWGWTSIGAFAVYKLIAWRGLSMLKARASTHQPIRLLLLRVFGFRRRTQRLFDLLGARWRYTGLIRLIAAPDLASRSIDVDKFIDFLGSRLRQRFIIDPSDLDRRMTELEPRLDPDGRYRVHELFCGNDAWEPAVKRLMAESEFVVMDLRDFSQKNQGCIFELQSLIDIVPIARVVLMIDGTTDVAFLRAVLAERWRAIHSASPNCEAVGSLTLMNVGRRQGAVAEALLTIADNYLARDAVPVRIDKGSALV